MTIKEAREKIEELEYLITDEIEKLEKETGLTVDDIYIERIQSGTLSDDKIIHIINRIKIRTTL